LMQCAAFACGACLYNMVLLERLIGSLLQVPGLGCFASLHMRNGTAFTWQMPVYQLSSS
jgi:hypothetical protein